MKISHLNPGDNFEFKNLEMLRNGVLIRLSSGTALAEYEEFNSRTGAWNQKREYLSHDVDVVFTGSSKLIETETGLKVEKGHTGDSGAIKGHSIIIPDGEFSIKQMAERNNRKPSQIQSAFKKLLESNKVKFVRVQSTGGRGKPAGIFTKVQM